MPILSQSSANPCQSGANFSFGQFVNPCRSMPILSNQCQYGVNPGSIFHPQPNFSIAQFMQFCKFANPIQSVPIRANLCQSEPRAKQGQSDNDNLPISCKNADISAVDNFSDNIAHPYGVAIKLFPRLTCSKGIDLLKQSKVQSTSLCSKAPGRAFII